MKLKKTVTYCMKGSSLSIQYSRKIMPKVKLSDVILNVLNNTMQIGVPEIV